MSACLIVGLYSSSSLPVSLLPPHVYWLVLMKTILPIDSLHLKLGLQKPKNVIIWVWVLEPPKWHLNSSSTSPTYVALSK